MEQQPREAGEEQLRALAMALRRRRLAGAAALFARTFAGLGVVVSHVALLVQPLAPHQRWREQLGSYALLFEEQQSWQTLIQLLEAQDS